MALTREAATQVAIATNLNFLLLENIANMNRALVKGIDIIGMETQESKELVQALSKGLVISKAMLNSVMTHYDTMMGDFIDADPEGEQVVKDSLENDLILNDLEIELNKTSKERLMEILTKGH